MPVLLRDGLERLRPRDAGVVDQDVHTAKSTLDVADQPFDRGTLGDIRPGGQAPAPQAFNRSAGLRGVVFAGVVRDRDVSAGLGQSLGDRPADSRDSRL